MSLVIENLRTSIGGTFSTFVNELRQIGRDVSLRQFLSEAGAELGELYRNPGWTWTRLRRDVGLPTPSAGPREAQISRGISRLLHADDRERLSFLRDLFGQSAPPSTANLSQKQRRVLMGVNFTLWSGQATWPDLDASMSDLWVHPAILAELRELFEILEDEASHVGYPLDGDANWSSVPLSVHASYSLDEILTAFGEMSFEKPHRIREGTTFNNETQSDLFFVTPAREDGEALLTDDHVQGLRDIIRAV